MNLVNRLVVSALLGGAVCACLVVFVFGTGLQIRHAWYALIPAAIGAVLLLVLRRAAPES